MPDNIARTHTHTRQQYFDHIVNQIVDELHQGQSAMKTWKCTYLEKVLCM